MKTILRFFLCLVLFNLSNVAIAQKPVYPKPNNKDNIPFGQKLPAPALYDRGKKLPVVNDKKVRDLLPGYFDSATHRLVQNRPGSQSFSPVPSGRNSNSTQVAEPANPLMNVHLTRDINTNAFPASGYPENSPANSRYQFAVLNNVSYFSAEDAIHGRELWRSDGTNAGTYLVKDINPGAAGSYAEGIIAANGLLYFNAYTAENGYEPWVSDGTAAGTHILFDLVAGIESSYPNQFVNVNGTVFFLATVFNNYNVQVWKTNGTEEGTDLVKDISSESIGYFMLELTAVNDMAYFIAYTFNTGWQLFRSDGTDAGTYIVKEIGFNYNDFTAPMQLTAYDNQLFFSVDDGSGRRLWMSDGTWDGTHYAPGYNEVLMQTDYLNIYNNRPFSVLNNQLFIAGYLPSDAGGGLYKYDAANDLGEVLVKDLTDIPDYPFDDVADFVVPVDFEIVNNELSFKVISSINGWHDELWRSGGETDNTYLVKVVGLTDPGVYAYNFTAANGILYFNINNEPGIGNELWKSDGTEAGTVLVKDFYPGELGSYPDDLTFCNGKLLFRVNTVSNGVELGQSDGTEAGTSLVKDINSNVYTDGSEAGGSFYKGLSAIGDDVLFNAFTPDLGAELYRSDGTEAGTVLLNDIWPGPDWSYPNGMLFKNNATWFINDNAIGTSLYKTDGTTTGLQRVTAYIDRNNYAVHSFNVSDNGQLFYILYNYYNGDYELWNSKGTATSGTLLKAGLYYDTYVVFAGNTAFFVAGDFNSGFELWKSDGSIAGTRMVKDINPGYNGSFPYSLFGYKNKIYFGAYDGYGYYNSFWQSDGTEKGTVKLQNVTIANYQYPHFPTSLSPQVYCISNGILYFTATNYTREGDGLWTTNGTAKGTKLVKNINAFYTSYLYNLTDVNGTIYFTGDDGVHGEELWKSNGTEKSTVMVKDIAPGGYGYYYNLCSAGGKLYFLNYNTYPSTLWSSDGTADNTTQVMDAGLDGLYAISNLTPMGSKLFFGAYTQQYGTELYVGDLSGKTMQVSMVSSKTLEPTNTNFDAAIYPNPSYGNATLTISGNAKNVTITITDVSGKTTWNKGFKDQRTINMPIGKMSAGVYLVTVKNSKESKSLKLIKQ